MCFVNNIQSFTDAGVIFLSLRYLLGGPKKSDIPLNYDVSI